MSKSHSPSLEITVISAEGLHIRKRSIAKDIFVTVRTDPINQQSTKLGGDGGLYPTWNEKLQLPLSPTLSSKRVVGVEVQRKKSSGANEKIGTANIPMSDVVGDYIPANHLHFLSYRLQGTDGGRNGIINLSVKVVGLQRELGGKLSSPSPNSRIAVGIPVTPRKQYASTEGVPVGFNYKGMPVSRYEYVKS